MTEKLVRDNIPDIIRNNGETPKTRTLDEDEYLLALDEKLREEVAEYLEANDLSELADITEVIHAIAAARGSSMEQVEAMRVEKLKKRGGFKDRISLISE
ncbi:MAG: nucleoside triphosphate pyrophosphohydrolase [Actinobacteria bacterium]|nr:nucleoside triphosphate pyrophosphohydrolase [Actinomycetota bacterium]